MFSHLISLTKSTHHSTNKKPIYIGLIIYHIPRTQPHTYIGWESTTVPTYKLNPTLLYNTYEKITITVHIVIKINISITSSAFFQYYWWLFKLEVIQDTGSDLEHIKKNIVECVLVLFQHTRPPLTFSGWEKQVELMGYVWAL